MRRKVGRWTSYLVGAAAVGVLLVAGQGHASGEKAFPRFNENIAGRIDKPRTFKGVVFGSLIPKFDLRTATRIARKTACPMIAYSQHDRTQYSSQSTISRATITGDGLRVLAESASQLEDPQWFPDGRKVLYINELDHTLMTVDVDGAVQEEIPSAAPWYSADLSPDGTRVAYASNFDPSALVEIDVAQAMQGGNGGDSYAVEIVNMMHQLSPETMDQSDNPETIEQQLYRPDIVSLSYSHAGDKIAFQVVTSASASKLYIINRDGTDLREVDGNAPMWFTTPVWSFDDAYIAYANRQIYIAKVDTLEKINIGQSTCWSPQWRGMSHSVYFTCPSGAEGRLMFAEISPEGSFGPQSVIRRGVFQSRSLLSGNQQLKAISPDGRFAAIVGDQQDRLFLEEIDGPYLVEMPNPSGRLYGMVAWQPGSYAGLNDLDGDGVVDACGN